MIPIILSILFPGLGQIYYGKYVRAIIMIIIALTPLYPAALVWSIIDAIRLNKKGIEPRFPKKEAVWSIILFVVVIPVGLFIAFSGMISLGQWYSNNFLKKNATLEEGNKIVSALQNYKESKGQFPMNISELIGSIPVRKGWRTDSWGEAYIYDIEDKNQGYKLFSKGKDRILGTEDDIVFE